MSTDQINMQKKKKKILYLEVHYEVAEEAASARSCRQRITKSSPKTQRVNQAGAQDPSTGADPRPAAEQHKSVLSPCSELVAEQQPRQWGLTAPLVLCLERSVLEQGQQESCKLQGHDMVCTWSDLCRKSPVEGMTLAS